LSLNAESLVLYKNRPALVRQAADKKLTIDTVDGELVSVRPKDVTLLHPGPSPHPRHLRVPSGDPRTAWELLDGGRTTLAELAELAYGDYSPATAWAAWQLVAEGLYFTGAPEAIIAHTPAKLAELTAARETKAAEERHWAEFVARVGAGLAAADDERYMPDVIALALGRSETSHTLRRMGREQTRENAHALLLAIGRWQPADNPYPLRLGLTMEPPEYPAGPLLDEPRRDLTHLTALAIDDEGSGDPDDALSVEGELLWVHVADVAALVAPDSPSDLAARERAVNLYLPEGTARMLPQELTDRLALGLQPVSPALSFALRPLPDGDFELVEITPSWVRVTRTTYEAAEERLHESPYRELLALAEGNRARRLANGATEIELPEVKIRATVDGAVTIRSLLPLRSRALVREAMLMAGEAAGRLGTASGLPLAYTIQDPPAESAPFDPAGPPSAMWARRRSMQRSRPSTAPGRHAGLGLDVYVQVTSPLRRYLDLLAHQQLRAQLRDAMPLDMAAVTLRLGEVEAVAGAARAAERQSNQHWTLVYLLHHPEWRGEGIVVENKPGRDVVLIPELAWEAEIYGRPARPLDSEVTLHVDSVDLPNRAARFSLV
jgi:exoribonuclease-2